MREISGWAPLRDPPTGGIHWWADGSDKVDPAQMVLFIDPSSTTQKSYVTDPWYGEQAAIMQSGLQNEDRYEAWGRVQDRMAVDRIYVPLWYENTLMASGPKIVEWEPYPIGYILNAESIKLQEHL